MDAVLFAGKILNQRMACTLPLQLGLSQAIGKWYERIAGGLTHALQLTQRTRAQYRLPFKPKAFNTPPQIWPQMQSPIIVLHCY
jgi:hypothetical protein